jgi:ADP-heptose:LPS heptosyltransferase
MHEGRIEGRVSRPLLVRFGAMGDMVILTAAIRALHQRFGCPVDVACCGGWVRQLLEGQPWVGSVYTLYTRQLPYALNPQQWLFVSRLRARGVGRVWICQADDVSHSLIARAGYDAAWCVSWLDYHVHLGEHSVDHLLRMTMATPAALATPPPCVADRYAPQLRVSEEWKEETRAWLAGRGLNDRPIILIQAGNKRTMRLGSPRRKRNEKYWPESNWATVIEQVHGLRPDAAIILLGVRLESALNRAILRRTRTSAAINAAGDVPIRRLLALSSQALGMISVDTGPAHVAAAVGCPLVVLFGSKPPSFYAPRGDASPVEVVAGSLASERPILDITPTAVATAWERVLRATEVARSAHMQSNPDRHLRSSRTRTSKEKRIAEGG